MEKYLLSNTQELLNCAKTRSSWLITKIEKFRENKLTFTERTKYTTDIILDMILKEDIIICSIFRKDPIKQQVHEKTQFATLKANKYPDIIKPRPAIYLYNGKFEIVKQGIKRPLYSTKTFDFYIPSQNKYCICKYTKENGGSQDNQYKDVKDFLRQIIQFYKIEKNTSKTFSFYLDGKYYNSKRIQELCNYIPNIFRHKIEITKVWSE